MTTELNEASTPMDDDFRSHRPKQDKKSARTGSPSRWLYPRATAGRYTRWRTVVAWLLLALLFGGPFLSRNGEPLFLFNVLERKFNFFGITFWPQDFHLVAIGLLAFIVFISLFTVVYGRVWCGWACPQTIFMEMVFRKIEIWIEGDHTARKRLDASPWTVEKIARKSAKHGVFFAISFLISNTFLAYIIGKDALLQIITDNPANHLGGLVSILVFTGVFYAVFAWLREIVCTTICPYGRLQTVLIDRKTLVVTYDDVRGEPRGKKKRGEQGWQGERGWQGLLGTKSRDTLPSPAFPAPHAIPATPAHPASPPAPKGDCVDCKLCVQVCPTGIDIRNGIQMECINCTACMDACDDVMDKVGRPRGLIRYDSLDGIQTRKPWRLTGRMVAYTIVLMLVMTVWGFLLASRSDLETTVLRAPGQLFQREANGQVSNLYLVELVNKTHKGLPITLRVNQPGATIRMVQPIGSAAAGELTKGTFFILLPEKHIHETSTSLNVEIVSNGVVIDRVKTTFLGPVH